MKPRSPIILRRNLRNDPIIRADRQQWPLATRRAFLKAIGAGAFVAAVGRYQKTRARMGRGGSGSTSSPGFYPAGHWVAPWLTWNPSSIAATLIYPRPDSETNSYARHRLMYYDGTTAFRNVVPLVLRGGAFPYVFQLMEAPSAAGAQIGAAYWQPGWTTAQALAAGYGEIWATPTGNFTAGEFWYRVWDQTGNYNDVIFTSTTMNTYNSTSGEGFVVLDPVNGIDPTSYSTIPGMSNPAKTFNWLFGAVKGDTTYPNAIIILRGSGAANAFAQDTTYGMTFYAGAGPLAIIGFPNDPLGTPTIDATNAASLQCFADYDSGCADRFVGDWTGTGGPAASNYFRWFGNSSDQPRITANNISLPNLFTGTTPTANNNCGPFYLSDSGSIRPYVALRGITQTNASAPQADYAFAIITCYRCQYMCINLCSVTNNGTGGMTIKASNSDVTVRNCLVQCTSGGGWNLNFYDQTQATGVYNQNREVCFCTLDATLAPSDQQFQVNGSYSAAAPAGQQAFGPTYSYRNSYLGCPIDVNDPATPVTNGPFASTNDAIEWTTSATQAIYISRAAATLPSNVTNSGTDCQAESGVFIGSGNYSFTSAYSAFAGLRGAIIQ